VGRGGVTFVYGKGGEAQVITLEVKRKRGERSSLLPGLF